VAITDLRTIKWLRVTRVNEPPDHTFDYAVSPASEDVAGALTWLACQEPAQLGWDLLSFVVQAPAAGQGSAAGPNAAPAAGQELQVTGFLGSGATSEVYSALTAEGQVRWLGARRRGCRALAACSCASALALSGRTQPGCSTSAVPALATRLLTGARPLRRCRRWRSRPPSRPQLALQPR
jgi:hypothetical protein